MIKTICDVCSKEEQGTGIGVESGELCTPCYENYESELYKAHEKNEKAILKIKEKYHDTTPEKGIDPNHEHQWTVAYRSKYNMDFSTTYHCKPCGAFKTEDALDDQSYTRLSNMGGDTVKGM